MGEWHDNAALEAHYRSDAFKAFQFGLHGLLARPSTMTVYEVDAAARPLSPSPMDPREAD